ncbi:hypothetical protein GCM10009718_04560 [Isoptericola halotolerans]|uniref:Uncharacterized protein n=1 Tax=Isoptericola halotolerans TaxID=300560 RepID=A0ABX2A401_9MICO|nr:hypothetical protein [Isoptericola halotolerans]NOV96620.1 hypothetical protein [Isoptericola halotolerans]
MIIEIRLVARLFRIPLLRVEGRVALRDLAGAGIGQERGATGRRDGAPAVRHGGSPSSLGRDLAVAEAILAELDARPGRLHPPVRGGLSPRPGGRAARRASRP